MHDAAAAGLAVTGLQGCATGAGSTSYLDGLIATSDRSTLFYWTDLMLQGVRDLSLTPLQATRGFAMAHAAGALALGKQVNGERLDPPERFDPDCAYAVAFSVALEEAWSTSFLLPRRRFVAGRADSGNQNSAVEWGRKVASHVIRSRIRDGAEVSRSDYYIPLEHRGGRVPPALRWNPTGPLYGARSGPSFARFQRGESPAWGWQRPWVISDPDAYRPAPFPDYRSAAFKAQFNKVLALGRDRDASRSEEQSAVALFWEDGPRGISNPGHFQLIAIDIAQRQNWSLADQAVFFSTLSLAQADAAIIAWRSKYQFDVLRPETAIRFAGSRFAGEQGLTADPHWQSYIPTPAFPSYVSGHSVFGATSMRVIARLLGTDAIDVSSEVPDLVNWPTQLTGMVRSWRSLRAIAEENGISREYGGVHWEADNEQGLEMGNRLAMEVVDRLAPEIVA